MSSNAEAPCRREGAWQRKAAQWRLKTALEWQVQNHAAGVCTHGKGSGIAGMCMHCWKRELHHRPAAISAKCIARKQQGDDRHTRWLSVETRMRRTLSSPLQKHTVGEARGAGGRRARQRPPSGRIEVVRRASSPILSFLARLEAVITCRIATQPTCSPSLHAFAFTECLRPYSCP